MQFAGAMSGSVILRPSVLSRIREYWRRNVLNRRVDSPCRDRRAAAGIRTDFVFAIARKFMRHGLFPTPGHRFPLKAFCARLFFCSKKQGSPRAGETLRPRQKMQRPGF
jgi:hypothetical protein